MSHETHITIHISFYSCNYFSAGRRHFSVVDMHAVITQTIYNGALEFLEDCLRTKVAGFWLDPGHTLNFIYKDPIGEMGVQVYLVEKN